ncbi:GGDEF domain-containing protein [Devosia pacifica]|uniref:GGDEF domain-containing protein n=1 Tax=Devosia pacifica TaxID=1335967 RepID=UPI00167AE4AD|nr:GGDEF domain-containing protein [Devosia pacifica]
MQRSSFSLPRWASINRWAIVGPLICVVLTLIFNSMLFADLGEQALERALISSIVVPLAIALPFFTLVGAKMRSMAIANSRLSIIARTDTLTACMTRAAFTRQVEDMLDNRAGMTGALLMLDADFFKAINDQYGHPAGDQALCLIARSIRTTVRRGDLVGRMGGEEFAVFMPGASSQDAEQVAERIRRSVRLAMFTPDGSPRSLSVSIGGASLSEASGFSELVRTADRQLYLAKQAGRDSIRIASLSSELSPDVA